MPKVSPIQSNFNGGEISPLLYGRVDSPRYKDCLAICENYLPLIQGPITRRPGSMFVFPVKDSSKRTRLIPFEFSTVQTYMLEFGENYIRFYKNNGIITNSSKNITAISQASPGVVTSNSHGFSNLQHIVIASVSGMTELNNREFVVANVTMNTFTLVDNITGVAVDTSALTAYISGGTAAQIYEVATVYSTADIPSIKYTQSDDVLYLAHPSYPPAKVIRLADNSWTFDDRTFIGSATKSVLNPFSVATDGPYYEVNITDTTFAGTKAGGSPLHPLVITASSTAGINGGLGFVSTDVGRILRMQDDNSSDLWTWFTIKTVNSSTSVDTHGPTLGNAARVLAATAFWRMGFWSETDGFPSTVVFHEDRLVFGGAGGDATRFDGSNTADYQNFSPSIQDPPGQYSDGDIANNNSYSFSLVSNDVNSILWMTSDEQGLVMGTTGGEWLVTSANSTSGLSPTSVSAKKMTSQGSANIQAVQSGKCTLFVQRGTRVIRELNYYYDVNGFRAADLTQISEHVTQSGLTFISVQKFPQPIVWAVRTDGVLLAMTYERELDALKVGWSRHIMGGEVTDGDAAVESVAVLPTTDGTSQDVWIIVQRRINGSTVRYVEYLTQLFDTNTDIEDAFFVDAGLTYNGVATTTVTGLNHLNGQTVSILADGIPQEAQGVISGKIILDTAASIITVGLPYDSDGQALRRDAGSTDGTAMGKTRRTHRLAIQFLNTLGFQLGEDFDTLDEIALDQADDGNFDEALGLYTGITSEIISMNYDFDNMFCWRQSQPLPGTILGFYPQMVTQDRG